MSQTAHWQRTVLFPLWIRGKLEVLGGAHHSEVPRSLRTRSVPARFCGMWKLVKRMHLSFTPWISGALRRYINPRGQNVRLLYEKKCDIKRTNLLMHCSYSSKQLLLNSVLERVCVCVHFRLRKRCFISSKSTPWFYHGMFINQWFHWLSDCHLF